MRRPDAISKNVDIFDQTIYRSDVCASFCYANITMAIRNPRLAYYFYFLSFLLSAFFVRAVSLAHSHSLVGHTLLPLHVVRSNLMNKVCANCVCMMTSFHPAPGERVCEWASKCASVCV